MRGEWWPKLGGDPLSSEASTVVVVHICLHVERTTPVIQLFYYSINLTPQHSHFTPYPLSDTLIEMTSTLQSIAAAIPSVGRAKLLINSNDDVVICAAVRTALTKVSCHSIWLQLSHQVC